jgi:carboxymethylenebutenolidase
MTAGTVTIHGPDGADIEAYVAQPVGDDGPYGAVVVIHHLPGYDEANKEVVRQLAHHRYLAICPNLFSREAPGAPPDEATATIRALGGITDEQMVGDVDAAAEYLKALASSNGKVATLGFCSGGRHSFVAACNLQLDAAVDCYGAFVLTELPEGFPIKTVRPVGHLTPKLNCPLLCLFGAKDPWISQEETEQFATLLQETGKDFEFHTFENAGHAFFATDRPDYAVEAAKEGWAKIWDFFDRHLASGR